MAAPALEEQLGWGATKRHLRFVEELRLSLGMNGNVCPKALVVADVDGDGGNEVAVATTAGDLFVWRRLGCEERGSRGLAHGQGKGESKRGNANQRKESGRERGRERGRENGSERGKESGRERAKESKQESESLNNGGRDSDGELVSETVGDSSDTDAMEESVRGRTGVLSHFDSGEDESEWTHCRCSGLGTVTSLAVGDLRNSGRPSLVACSAEGQCFVFDFDARYLSPTVREGEWEITAADEAEIPVNTSVAVMWDVEGRGETDLIIGTTDRKVQALRLHRDGRTGDVRFTQRGCWQLKEQVVSLCPCDHYVVGPNSRHQRVVIAGLQGGIYAVVSNYTGLSGVVYRQASAHVEQTSEVGDPIQDLLALGGPPQPKRVGTKVVQSNTLLTEVIVCRTRSRYKRELHVICSNMAGVVTAQGMDGSVQWERHLAKPLFSLSAVDITGDGNEEVVVTSNDGVTFILDCHTGEFLTHKLRMPLHSYHGISASLAATLEDMDGTPMPCLIYISFSGQLFAYFDASVDSISSIPVALQLRDRLRVGSEPTEPSTGDPCESSRQRLRAALYETHLAERRVNERVAVLAGIRAEKARLEQQLHDRQQGNASREDSLRRSMDGRL